MLSLAARPLRAAGTRFVFDHHDLMPELYRSRFGRGGRRLPGALAIERLAFRTADVSLPTNGSYARIAVERGAWLPTTCSWSATGPTCRRFAPVAPDPSWPRGRHLIAYLGVMGPQDGIDHALARAGRAAGRRDDWHAVFIGDGDELGDAALAARARSRRRCVEFAGWREDDDIRAHPLDGRRLPGARPAEPAERRSTMIKIPEYMAMGRRDRLL